MKDDILRFRKVCDVLMKEQKYTQSKLCAEMGVSEPTIMKLLKGDLAEFKIRASVLGVVQDFCEKHCDDLKYAGINSTDSVPEKVKEALKKTGESIMNEAKQKEEKLIEEIEPAEAQTTSFTDLLIEFAKSLPANVSIQISINGGEK